MLWYKQVIRAQSIDWKLRAMFVLTFLQKCQDKHRTQFPQACRHALSNRQQVTQDFQ